MGKWTWLQYPHDETCAGTLLSPCVSVFAPSARKLYDFPLVLAHSFLPHFLLRFLSNASSLPLPTSPLRPLQPPPLAPRPATRNFSSSSSSASALSLRPATRTAHGTLRERMGARLAVWRKTQKVAISVARLAASGSWYRPGWKNAPKSVNTARLPPKGRV